MIRISIIGATGYTGRELIRYLLRHPQARLVHCTSQTQSGRPLAAVHREFTGRLDLTLEKLDATRIAQDTDAVFLCLPHAQSARTGKEFLDRGVKVIDLSADFRLKDPALYREWYENAHPHPALLKKAVYGLPEVHRSALRHADLIANPGCYATTSILSCLPLARKNLVRGEFIIDAKSGVSGAGKKLEPRTLYCEANENFLAYAVARHRHAPEIEQELRSPVTFVPHLLPVERGILVTVYAQLKKTIRSAELAELYAEFYRGEPFVQVLPEGQFPELRSVQNTNFCQIGVRVEEKKKRAIVIGALDNLGKGASGQAVQNLNLRFGLEETTGLG